MSLIKSQKKSFNRFKSLKTVKKSKLENSKNICYLGMAFDIAFPLFLIDKNISNLNNIDTIYAINKVDPFYGTIEQTKKAIKHVIVEGNELSLKKIFPREYAENLDTDLDIDLDTEIDTDTDTYANMETDIKNNSDDYYTSDDSKNSNIAFLKGRGNIISEKYINTQYGPRWIVNFSYYNDSKRKNKIIKLVYYMNYDFTKRWPEEIRLIDTYIFKGTLNIKDLYRENIYDPTKEQDYISNFTLEEQTNLNKMIIERGKNRFFIVNTINTDEKLKGWKETNYLNNRVIYKEFKISRY
jgi:hypothetical protein